MTTDTAPPLARFPHAERELTPHGNCMPVNRVSFDGRVQHSYPSLKLAIKGERLARPGICRSLETGLPHRGRWFRYADMPDNCQPLRLPARKPRREHPQCINLPVRVRGMEFPSMTIAAQTLGVKYQTLWMECYRNQGRRVAAEPDHVAVEMATTG